MKTTSGNHIVDEMAEIQITGNVIPPQWYKTILYPSGKPYLTAIVILSDIVFWYRPQLVRDESSGQLTEVKKRFRADLLQRSYEQLSEQFGISKREATNAIIALEKLGVVNRIFRTISAGGVTSSNILFLELIPSKVKELTYGTKDIAIPFESDSPNIEKADLSLSKETPPTLKSGTYTETTPETSTKIKETKESKRTAPPPKKSIPSFNDIIDGFTSDSKLRKTLRNWLQTRYRIKKPLTNKSLEIALARLATIAENNITLMIETIENAIINNYPDFVKRPATATNFNPPQFKQTSAHNYSQRSYTEEELNSLMADVASLI